MTAQEMWEQYTLLHPEDKDAKHEFWCYGSVPDKLLALTLEGTKTATASAYPMYEHEKCAVPKAGDFSVICDSENRAGCVIKTVKVFVVPFKDVTEHQAYMEGEGTRTLSYWREVHRECFSAELAQIGEKMTEDTLIVCEEFEVVYA